MDNFDFFTTIMPKSRLADYYIGCHDSSVFIDFNNCEDDKICLVRISFDGYGCCNLGDNAIPLNKEDSAIFKKILQNQMVNQSIMDQHTIEKTIKKVISLNESLIWADALEEYQLI
ncbi:MAG: hypothetical protein LIR40_02875 [Bacteroidota bacterium]|nr:hypothetical protein [Bacteroidota bacterium]